MILGAMQAYDIYGGNFKKKKQVRGEPCKLQRDLLFNSGRKIFLTPSPPYAIH